MSEHSDRDGEALVAWHPDAGVPDDHAADFCDADRVAVEVLVSVGFALDCDTQSCILAALAQPPPKPIVWIGSSLDDLRRFPEGARNEAGHQLHRVQCGLEPTDWKPMRSIGVGVSEVRIRTGREHRVCFVARFAEAVYVLHAFEKKSAKTTRVDLELGAQRLKAVLERRARRGGGP